MKYYKIYNLCAKYKWSEVRKYLSSDAAEEEKKANIMYRNDHYWGRTSLYVAIYWDAPDDIIKAMLDIGGKELVMMNAFNGNTALHFACDRGTSYNIIKMLIDVGGKDLVMTKDNNGDTALHDLCLCIKRHAKAAEIIKLILQVGDTNLLLATKNHDGKTPLKIATANGASEKIKRILTVQSNSNSRRSNNNSSVSIVPADNGSNTPTKESNLEQHTTRNWSSTNNDPNLTIHRLQSQLKEARKNAEMIQQDFDKKCADLEKEAGSRIKKAEEQTLKIQQDYDQKCADCCHLEEINQVESTDNLKWGSTLAMKSKELYQCKRMSEDLEKKNKDLDKVIEIQRADIALLVKQEEKSKIDNAHLKDRIDDYMQICSEQNPKLQNMADMADVPVAGIPIKCEAEEDEVRQGEEDEVVQDEEPEQHQRTPRDLENELENERAEIAALSEKQSSIENECEDERYNLTQISSPKRKAELQPLNETTIARSTKRKPCGEDHQEEHQEEEEEKDEESSGAASQSQSSKRSRIGNAADTGSVASGRSQAYDDDLEMIAKELLHEKDMYTKLMNRYLHARRELQRRG
jgi:hypothetical protein